MIPQFQFLASSSNQSKLSQSGPSPITILRGIKECLKEVVENHHKQYCRYVRLHGNNENNRINKNNKKNRRRKIKDNVEIVEKANVTWNNTVLTGIDPFSIDGYFCMICNQELSNIYLHCIGCEEILGKDFNLCINCHQQQKYKKLCIINHDNCDDSSLQHDGDVNERNKVCQNCITCKRCGYCEVCSCQCHTNFNLFFRFMNMDLENEMLKHVISVCHENIATKKEGENF